MGQIEVVVFTEACEAEAAKSGCQLDVGVSGQAIEISLLSPFGEGLYRNWWSPRKWDSRHGFERGFKPDWSKTLADVRRVIDEGFVDCGDADCGRCHAEGDEAPA